MRKAVIAIVTAAMVFGLTTAAASTLSIVGPLTSEYAGDFDPSCDLGRLTVAANVMAPEIPSSFTITPEKSGATCDVSYSVWIKIADVGGFKTNTNTAATNLFMAVSARGLQAGVAATLGTISTAKESNQWVSTVWADKTYALSTNGALTVGSASGSVSYGRTSAYVSVNNPF